MNPATPVQRLAQTDPLFASDVYNKLAALSAAVSAQNITPGTYTISPGTKITLNAQGQITKIG
jgi:hypothetical protein